MNVIILGSGGCVSTPGGGHVVACRVCTEARQKRFSYARTGCRQFVEDVNLLIRQRISMCLIRIPVAKPERQNLLRRKTDE